jgi:transposase
MMIIGVAYHPSFQTIAFFMEETGECGEQELNHSDGQAEKLYRDLKQRGISVRVGLEATGYSRWFERLLAELGSQLWIGDPAEIKAKRVKKHKFDREDAQLILRLMRENNFPQIWVPDPENQDLRQLLWHRHRLVRMRTRIMNQLHALAMNESYRWKKKLFSEQGRAQLEKLALAPWASRRQQQLLELLDRINPTIAELTVSWRPNFMCRSSRTDVPSLVRRAFHLPWRTTLGIRGSCRFMARMRRTDYAISTQSSALFAM